MKDAPSRVRTPVLSAGTLKNKLPTIKPITTICSNSQQHAVGIMTMVSHRSECATQKSCMVSICAAIVDHAAQRGASEHIQYDTPANPKSPAHCTAIGDHRLHSPAAA